MTAANAWLDAPWSERRSGRHAARTGDWRAWFDHDRARIIHSSAFRRLQTKTQVLGMGGSDFHRTRLTHSLETAQIAQGIVGRLAADPATPAEAARILPPAMLIEAVALAHDLGHPPFGHGGEIALNWCMRRHGGFEGNGQTLRVVARLEAHSGQFGLDLGRRTLLGLLKYPLTQSTLFEKTEAELDAPMRAADWRPVKAIFDADTPILDWIFAPLTASDRATFTNMHPDHATRGHSGFDTSILEIADDIAYGVHDLEDAIALKLVHRDQVHSLWSAHRTALLNREGTPVDSDIDRLFINDDTRKQTIGLLVNFFIIHIAVSHTETFANPLLAWHATLPPDVAALLAGLVALIRTQVILQPMVQMLEFRGQEIVRRLFETFASDPERFLPSPWRATAETDPHRTICDYVATMTDAQATRHFDLFFGAGSALHFGIM